MVTLSTFRTMYGNKVMVYFGENVLLFVFLIELSVLCVMRLSFFSVFLLISPLSVLGITMSIDFTSVLWVLLCLSISPFFCSFMSIAFSSWFYWHCCVCRFPFLAFSASLCLSIPPPLGVLCITVSIDFSLCSGRCCVYRFHLLVSSTLLCLSISPLGFLDIAVSIDAPIGDILRIPVSI